jgi:hypothetical protein
MLVIRAHPALFCPRAFRQNYRLNAPARTRRPARLYRLPSQAVRRDFHPCNFSSGKGSTRPCVGTEWVRKGSGNARQCLGA